jgi:capsid portal protein
MFIFSLKEKDVIMDNTVRKNFLANYENFITSKFIDAKTKKYINFRQVIRERVQQSEQAVINNEPYSPFILHA